MKNIAIIPARGGSKRLPGKNIHPVDGKPLIAYSISAAIDSALFDTVMVSTDSDDIAEIAKAYGASVPFARSQNTSNDFATTADVIQEVLECYLRQGITFTTFCCLYPTALFTTKDDLISSHNLLQGDTTAVISIAEYSSPIQRSLTIKNNNLVYNWPQYRNKRTQDLEQCYYDAGQFYWQEVQSFLQTNSLVSSNTKPYIISNTRVQDIDTLEDLLIAEHKFRYINENNNATI